MMPKLKQTNLFFKNIGLSYSLAKGFLGGMSLASLTWVQRVRITDFGPAPNDCRIISGEIPPETRAGQKSSTFGVSTATIKFTDHLSGAPS
jgi:hypothetical protein